MAIATVAAALAMGANAAAQQTGTLVVRLATDPAPPGVTWKYSGAGPAFKLGQAATEQTVALQPGSYQLHETGGRAGQPHTLTALVCVDPSGDTTTSVAQASASFTAWSIDRLKTPGIEPISFRTFSPGQINSG